MHAPSLNIGPHMVLSASATCHQRRVAKVPHAIPDIGQPGDATPLSLCAQRWLGNQSTTVGVIAGHRAAQSCGPSSPVWEPGACPLPPAFLYLQAITGSGRCQSLASGLEECPSAGDLSTSHSSPPHRLADMIRTCHSLASITTRARTARMLRDACPSSAGHQCPVNLLLHTRCAPWPHAYM